MTIASANSIPLFIANAIRSVMVLQLLRVVPVTDFMEDGREEVENPEHGMRFEFLDRKEVDLRAEYSQDESSKRELTPRIVPILGLITLGRRQAEFGAVFSA